MLKFNFDSGQDAKTLGQLHAAMLEDVTYVQPGHHGLSGWVPERELKARVYKWEADQLEYLVVYPEEFSMVQRMERGQVVPRTVHEIVCVH